MSNKFTREAIPALVEKVKEQAAELAALRAELSQLRIEREEGAEISADLTARAEAAEAKIAAALAHEERCEIEESWSCRVEMVAILRGVAK